MQAHDSYAASYVVPHDEFVWENYNPTQHGDLDTNDLTYKSGWYFGGGLGLTEASPEGTSGGFYVKDDRDWGYKVFLGWRFLPHWSSEVSFVDTGKAGLANKNPAISAMFKEATISYKIPTVSASYHLWGPTRDIDLFARVGISSIMNSVSDDRITYDKQTIAQLNLGAGVQWRFAPKWFVRAEYDGFDNDASMLAISIGRYLGRHDEHRIIEPTPVVQPPEPPLEVEPVEAPVPVKTCDIFNGAIEAIQFQTDSADLTETSLERLQEAAQSLQDYPSISIEIQAHTDSNATAEYNLDLSNKRAESIMQFLIENGIASERLTAKGFGESSPRATNDTEEGRALNRRVEFKIIDLTVCE